ncbi:ABC transporter permease [Paraburkholderia caballeronis]|uniref:NitT/TauT family transport system permease protein n=1 Tax=Paraburkholderia caballeronis TaxID=416943 RepID=A0A1H7SZB2_9BURK|nr:ABC transporter permease [Paraburkholderia caballeronis]PXW25758.1 NitT/TauT family transport system permease protein [Paraburkholderia caballeronis]PXX01365.1 NitT/TauT family transport system permease protein [Paraburkholderia caballeronis]RAJ99281.1 NitT/TauT family transport system permease protein [Paraburkholderia caballeronis]SEE23694.1 NitT/TauT family transport system permease protein [Paraburkholderia caballeronis]SEL78000.1 NitT/TauT family transport system permease protein [Para
MSTLNSIEVKIVADKDRKKSFLHGLIGRGWFMAIASPVLLLLIWEVLVRVGLLDPRFFPSPSSIIEEFFAMSTTPDLWIDIGYTISRMMIGFFLGAIPGVFFGVVMGISKTLRNVLQPIISAIYPIPKIALFPLVMLIFGLGDPSKWVIVAIAVFFQVFMSTLAGVVNIDRIYLDVAKNFHATRWQTYRTIALPASVPYIFTGFQLGMGMALIVVIIAENFGTNHGLGYVIWHSWQIFEVRDMFVALILVSLIGYLLQLGIVKLEQMLIPWKRPARTTR